MSLMFSRLARNFIKAGYFPTDEETLGRLIPMLRCDHGPARLLDPCCGEGTALADIAHGLRESAPDNPPAIETLAVEFDAERAWHAKTILDRVIHADVNDVVIGPRSIGLLFLNPPYGYGVADNAGRSAGEINGEKAERLERTFLRLATPLLAYGGVLIYIIPHYALDEQIRAHLARNYVNLRVFMAPERRFKQCVVVGVRRRSGNPAKAVLDMLDRAQSAEDGAPMLPDTDSWVDEPYQVPAIEPGKEPNFHAVRIDAPQLSEELNRLSHSLLWEQMNSHFGQHQVACRPPLREMTPWHLALSLAAGQINGRIQSVGGRQFLVKGDTFKSKDRKVTTETNEKGNVTQTVTMLDKFVPVINAIELTPDERLGQIVKIA